MMRFLILSLVAALLFGFAGTASAAETQAKVGEPAPDFELQSVRGDETHRLSDYQGKTVVLTWQGTGCPWNKMRENAGYERILYPMAQDYKDQDVVFLAINSNKTEPEEQVAAYARQHQTPYPILKDPGNKVADLYGAQTTPHFFVIDKEGVLRYQGGFEKAPANPNMVGQSDEAYLVPVLNALLAGEELPYQQTQPKGCRVFRE